MRVLTAVFFILKLGIIQNETRMNHTGLEQYDAFQVERGHVLGQNKISKT